MKRLITWTLVLICALVALVALLLTVPTLIDLSSFKSSIQSAFEERVHATIDFSSARLTLLPGPGVRLSDVVITNTGEGFAETQLLRAAQIDFRSQLSKLGDSHFVGKLRLVEPELQIAAKGSTNNLAHLFKSSRGAQKDRKEPSPTESTQLIKAPTRTQLLLKRFLSLQSVEIEKGTVLFRDLDKPSTEEPLQLPQFDLEISNAGFDRDIEVDFDTVSAITKDELTIPEPIHISGTGRIDSTRHPLSSFDPNLILQAIKLDLSLTIPELQYHQVSLTSLSVKSTMDEGRAVFTDLTASGLGGQIEVSGDADLNTTPATYKADLSLQDIRIEQLLAAIKGTERKLLSGKLSTNIKLQGSDNPIHSLKNMRAVGTFVLSDGELYGPGIGAVAQQEFNRLIEKLPFTKKNVVAFDPSTFSDQKLEEVRGSLRYHDERLNLSSQYTDRQKNQLTVDATIGLDTSLTGKGRLLVSEESKQKLLSKNKRFSLLFDEANQMELSLKLRGNIYDPLVAIDFDPLRKRFEQNAKVLIEKELNKLLGK